MRIKHSDGSNRPKWTDRKQNPTRNTSRRGTGSMCKVIIEPHSPAAGHETEQTEEREESDN